MAGGGEAKWGGLGGILMVFVLGCGEADAGAGGGGAAAVDEGAWPGPISVPMRPRSEGTLQSLMGAFDAPKLSEIVTVEGQPRIVVAMSVALAVGEGYPTTFTATLDSRQLAGCGALSGTIALGEYQGATGAISPELSNDARIKLTVLDVGRSEFVMRGTMTITEATSCIPLGEQPLELRLSVNAFKPTGAGFRVPSACSLAGTKRMAPARRMSDFDGHVSSDWTSMFRVFPLDQDGKPTLAWNAEASAQVSVRLGGPPSGSAAPKATATLDDVTFPNTPGPVTFTPAFGEPLTVHVVAPAEIDRLDVPFLLAGSAGTPLVLEDGARYDQSAYGRRLNRIAPMVPGAYVGSERLCSAPAESWFEWRSSSVRVCTTLPLESDYSGKFTFNGMSIGRAARLLTDGICTLTLRAPELLGGFEKTISADFRDVALLRDSL